MHSIHDEFKSIKKLGVYNPRKNKIYLINISDISEEVIDEVSHDIIGYEKTIKRFQNKQGTKENNEIVFETDDKVEHVMFGVRKVLNCEKIGKVNIVTVDFESVGQKKMHSAYLKLVK